MEEVRQLPKFAAYEKEQPFLTNSVPILVIHGGNGVASVNAATSPYPAVIIANSPISETKRGQVARVIAIIILGFSVIGIVVLLFKQNKKGKDNKE
jgi:hypothetical protein